MNKPFFLCLLLCVLPSCRNRATENLDLASENNQSLCGPSRYSRSDFSYYSLKERVSDAPERFQTLVDVLDIVPGSIKGRAFLSYSDRSMQPASLEKSDFRIVAFNASGETTLAVNPDGSSIEFLGFSKESSRLCAHKITYENEKLSFVDHPSSCGGSSCHRNHNDLVYRWDPYNLYPYIVGSSRDFFAKGSREYKSVKYFFEKKISSGIYRPFAKHLKLTKNDDVYSVTGYATDDFKSGIKTDQIQQKFSLVTSINNSMRLARKIEDWPLFSQYKFAIIGGLLGCEHIEKFVPRNSSSIFTAEWVQLKRETKRIIKENSEHRRYIIKKYNMNPDNQQFLENDDVVSADTQDILFEPYLNAIVNMRYLLEQRSDQHVVDMSDWSMAVTNKTDYDYSFAGGAAALTHAVIPLQRKFLPNDVEVASLVRSEYLLDDLIHKGKMKSFCNRLQKQSLEAFRE